MILTNSQYEQLMAKYYDRQVRTRHIAEQRSREVLAAIPELAGLDRKIQQLSLAHARTALEHDTSAAPDSASLSARSLPAGRKDQFGGNRSDYAEQIAAITAEKESLLVSHGFPADYLKPVYVCPDCRDSGYTEHGRCHCFEKEIVNFLYSQSNLQDILEHENFSHFNLAYYPDDYVEESTGQTPRDNMQKIYGIAQDFVKHFDDSRDNLLLYGNTGVGKTFLANCIAKELLDHSYTVVYLTSLKLFDILETYKFDRQLSQAEKNATVTYILDSDLLIIDDLGTELNNTFTSSQLYRCIDTRLNHGKSTVISTNLSFDDLREQYSERIFSRITSNYTLLKITGDDIRLKKALSQS